MSVGLDEAGPHLEVEKVTRVESGWRREVDRVDAFNMSLVLQVHETTYQNKNNHYSPRKSTTLGSDLDSHGNFPFYTFSFLLFYLFCLYLLLTSVSFCWRVWFHKRGFIRVIRWALSTTRLSLPQGCL